MLDCSAGSDGTTGFPEKATCGYAIRVERFEHRTNHCPTPQDGGDTRSGRFRHHAAECAIGIFLEKVRDIVNFKKSDNVVQIGKFSDPPRIEDLANLTLDRDEIDTIRRCRLNRCDFKLSAGNIDRFQKEMDWSAADYTERASALMRGVVLEFVRAYMNGGNSALGDYNDKPYKLDLADEFRSLLQPTAYMYGYGPEFHKYLSEFPKSRPGHVEDFLYWSKEKFGLKPVISATHVVVYRSSQAADSDILIASKGIYANHYFDASLGLTAFVNGTVSGQPQKYLIYINRSKADALRGMFAGFKRSLISGSLRDGAKKNMEMIKQKLETQYSDSKTRPQS